jgi:transposase-like protein
MTSTTGLVDRNNSRGQMRISRKKREALLAEFDQSGMSGSKFAKQAGIKYTTFAYWLQKRRRQRSKTIPTSKSVPGTRRKVRWLEAVVDGSGQKESPKLVTAILIVHGPGGIRLELSDDRQVKLAVQLLRELDGKRAC